MHEAGGDVVLIALVGEPKLHQEPARRGILRMVPGKDGCGAQPAEGVGDDGF
jgi:hypothetical protein